MFAAMLLSGWQRTNSVYDVKQPLSTTENSLCHLYRLHSVSFLLWGCGHLLRRMAPSVTKQSRVDSHHETVTRQVTMHLHPSVPRRGFEV